MTTLETTEYALGEISQIPLGEGREFAIGNTKIAVFHARNGAVYATQAYCPHRNGPLADGLLGGTTLVCPLHAWKFDMTTGQSLLGNCEIAVYPVRLTENDQIIVTWKENLSVSA